jgi:hypothetical protein
MKDVPFATPCERTEGSMRVSPCTKGMPENPVSSGNRSITMRRYVIDEVLGSADVFCSFTTVGNIPDSHELRIENGKLRYVHTITLCAIDKGPNWPTVCTPRNGTAKSGGMMRPRGRQQARSALGVSPLGLPYHL